MFSEEAESTNTGILHYIPNLVTEEENKQLITLPTREEVKDDVWTLYPQSSTSPDGFEEDCSDIIKHDVHKSAQEFFLGVPFLKLSLALLQPSYLKETMLKHLLTIGLSVFLPSLVK